MQYTYVSNIFSDNCRVKLGVPQGLVLGPLLFLIYVNDIGNAVPDANVQLFADDARLFLIVIPVNLILMLIII